MDAFLNRMMLTGKKVSLACGSEGALFRLIKDEVFARRRLCNSLGDTGISVTKTSKVGSERVIDRRRGDFDDFLVSR